jgi:hypothetical protein
VASHYVAPTGLATNDGTISSPWSLLFAVGGAGGAILSGDTVWLRGAKLGEAMSAATGLYTQGPTFIQTTSGVLGAGFAVRAGKILWRNYPGELVHINSTDAGTEVIRIDGNHNWWVGTFGRGEGLHVFRPVLGRDIVRGTNIWFGLTPQTGNKLIRIVTRDGSNGVLDGGFNPDYDYGELELYHVLAYNNGESSSGGTLQTHGFYFRHQGVGTLARVRKCIVFNQVGYCLHHWAERADGLRNIQSTDNIIWGAGVLGELTGDVVANILFAAANGIGAPTRGCICSRNVTLQLKQDARSSALLILGGLSNTLNEDMVAEDNYNVGGGRDDTFAMVRVFQFNTGVSPNLKFNRNEWIPLHDGNIVETVQAGSLALYTQWLANLWHTPAASAKWRQAAGNLSFAAWKAATGLGSTDVAGLGRPTVNKVFVIPAKEYNAAVIGTEGGALDGEYGNVCFFNWESSVTVAVDLSTILASGDFYEVYNAQDITGEPVLSGQYFGGSVAFPTSGKPAPEPIGLTPRPPISTAPFFDAFVVKKVVALAVGPVPPATPESTNLTVRAILDDARDEHHAFTQERHSNRALVKYLSERHRVYYKLLADQLKDRLSIETTLTLGTDGSFTLPQDSLQIVAVWATMTPGGDRRPVTWVPIGKKGGIPQVSGLVATVTGFQLTPLVNPTGSGSVWDSVASVTVAYVPEPAELDVTDPAVLEAQVSIPTIYAHALKWELAAFMARRERAKDPDFPDSLLKFFLENAKLATDSGAGAAAGDHRLIKQHRTTRNR